MAFKTSLTTGGTFLEQDFMFINSNNTFENGYDTTTTPSNEVKITASDGAADDQFGYSVAVGSGRIVVGSWRADNGGTDRGSAYIFDLNGNQLTKITASDAASGDRFGTSVAVGNDRIVVGSYFDDDTASSSGSAYIFDLNGNQLTKITASDPSIEALFGHSVAVGSGRIVVGAYGKDNYKGSAYIFDLNGNQLAKITASDGAANDRFGESVAVGNDRIVIGSQFDLSNAGSAYIFDLNGNEISKITPTYPSGRFGYSVAVGSGKIIIGAPFTFNLDSGQNSAGQVYIYDLNGNYISDIFGSEIQNFDFFGSSVAVGSGRIVVGAVGDDDNGAGSGSIYIFDLDGNELVNIITSDGAFADNFSTSLSVGSDKIVIGAIGDDDNGSGSGSAYIYDTPNIQHTLDILN